MDTVSKTSTLAACLQVFRLSLRRQFFTRQTIVMLVLLGLAVLITYLWSLPKQWHPDPRTSAELARQIVLPLYMGFLLPVICLGYASAAIADERTGETLVYLLTTNIPRPLVYLSKYAAALLLTHDLNQIAVVDDEGGLVGMVSNAVVARHLPRFLL